MSSSAPARDLSKAERRRRIMLGLLRSLVITVVLIGAYYLLPLSRLADFPFGLSLTVGVIALTCVAVLQVRWVVVAKYPAIRAIEAITTIAPLFLLLFSAIYFLMVLTDVGSFSEETLTRTDSLYFTVTVFATVGFGDITPVSQAARLMVTAQMILDLIVLGVGIRVFLGAVERGRQRTGDGAQAAEESA
jgi:hypothetical protein